MIIMPSLRRAGRCRTLAWLPAEVVTAVLRPEDRKPYREAYPTLEQVILPKWVSNVAETRQWIIRHFKQNHIQVDDDLRYRSLDGASPVEHFRDILARLDSYSMTSIGREWMGTMAAKEATYHYDKTCWEILGINYEDFKKFDISDLPLFSDAALNIHALRTRGTLVSYRGLSTNTEEKTGGIRYRTNDLVLQCRARLIERFPDYCKVVPARCAPTVYTEDGTMLRTSWSKIVKDRKAKEAL